MTTNTTDYTVSAGDALRLLSTLVAAPGPVQASRYTADDSDLLYQLASLGLASWTYGESTGLTFEPTDAGHALVARANEAARDVVGTELFDRAFPR